jgi:hypothetical protein
MKRILVSILIGCLLTGLLFAICQDPTSGPTPIVFVVVPFQILASLITKDRAVGEFVYYGIQIIVFGGMCYLVLRVFSCLRRDGDGK